MTSTPAQLSASSPSKTTAADADHPDIDFARRFGGVARLYGRSGLANFQAASVCVVGVGGVGSWVVEALARSAIGHITMVDLDNLAESNINRQIHALTGTLGMAKVTALAQRIAQINPFCEVHEVEDMLDAANLERLIGAPGFDFIIDAIDDVRAKTALIAYCRANKLRLVTIGGAGGQIDPTRIEVRDLCRTEQEPLLAKVRKRLRAEHGFPRGTKNKFGIDAVFSTEPLQTPEDEEAACAIDVDTKTELGDMAATAVGAGRVDDAGLADNATKDVSLGISGLNCAGYGSAVVVTAAFGLVAAAHVLRALAALPAKPVEPCQSHPLVQVSQ